MEENVKVIVAKNLTELRKSKNLTQGELAAQLNYSDKSVSKWENGDSLPDIAVLYQVAELYGVTLNDLVKENAVEKTAEKKTAFKKIEWNNNLVILCLWIAVACLIATILYVYLKLKADTDCWQAFIWVIPASALLFLRFNKRTGGSKKLNAWGLSVLVWSLLLAVFLQFYEYELFLIFSIGIPLQVIVWLSSKLN